MYFLQLPKAAAPARDAIEADEARFPPGLRLKSQTARDIYELIAATVGEGFRWSFPDSREILWDWSRLRSSLESGSGWTLPDPAGRGLRSHARLTIELVDGAGLRLSPISFIAKPTGDAMLYELTGVLMDVGASLNERRLAVELTEVIRAQKERQLRERAKLQQELSATEAEIEIELEEEFGGSDLVELFEALALEESSPKPTVRRLTHRERMDQLRHRRGSGKPRTI